MIPACRVADQSIDVFSDTTHPSSTTLIQTHNIQTHVRTNRQGQNTETLVLNFKRNLLNSLWVI